MRRLLLATLLLPGCAHVPTDRQPGTGGSGAAGVERATDGRILRHREVVRAFMRAHPCPGGPDKGSTERCRGYEADHAVPLCLGGPDAVFNLQWQQHEEALEKDKVEWQLCKAKREEDAELQRLREALDSHEGTP